jgi:uncharacterized protein HemX
MSTFAQLKKSNDNLSRLLTEVDKVNTPQKSNNSNADERFWRPELDKNYHGFVSSIMGFKVLLVNGILRILSLP